MATRPVDPKTYVKNVLKSAGYITKETMKGINPSLTSFIDDTGSTAKEMYHSVRDIKGTIKSKVSSVVGDSGWEDLKKVKGNAFEDLKTGKFYNKDREDAAQSAFMKSMGFDFDDLNLDVEFDENEKDNGEVTSKTVTTIADKISFSQQKASELSAERIVSGTRGATKASMAMNQKWFGNIYNSLSVVNSSIMALHQDLATPLNTHIINSANFYNSATQELAKQTAYLENMNKLLNDRYAPKKNGFSNNGQTDWDKVMGNGLPDFKALGGIAKNKFMNSTGMGMMKDFMDPEMFQMLMGSGMLSSPIAMATTMILTNKIQNGPTGKAMDRFVETLKGGFATSATRLHKFSKGSGGSGFTQFMRGVAGLFDITPEGRTKVDFSKYNKGRADWTGKDSKALQEVIPNQLAQIISALTGNEGKVFDYDTGRWKTVSSIKRDFNSKRFSNMGKASTGLRDTVIDEFINEDRAANAGNSSFVPYNKNSKAVRTLSKDYDTLISLMTMARIDPATIPDANSLIRLAKAKKWVSAPGTSRPGLISEPNLKTIARLIYKNNGAQGRLTTTLYSGRIADNNFVSSSSNNTVFGQIANGSDIGTINNQAMFSKNSIINNTIDDKGHNIFFYLQDYYSMLRRIAEMRTAGNAGGYNESLRSQGAPRSFEVPYERGFRNVRYNQLRTENRRRNNSRGLDLSDLSDPEGRLEYNRETGQYEAPKPRTTTRADRENEEQSSPVSRLIDGITGGVDKLFFGDVPGAIRKKIDENGGIWGTIKSLPKSIAELSTKAMDKVGELWGKFTGMLEEKGFFGAMKDLGKSAWQGITNYGKKRAGDVYEFFKGRRPGWEDNSGEADVAGAYRGGYVRRSGMASVSEGELIIPARRNPLYNGNMSDGTRRFVEQANYSKWLRSGGNEDDFYGFYATGGRVKALSKKKKDRIKYLYSQGYTPEEIAKDVKEEIPRVKSYITHARLQRAVDEAKDTVENAKKSKIGQKIIGAGKKAGNYIDHSLESLFGNPEKYKDFKKTGNEILDNIKKDTPKTLAAGTIGALTGAALTGSGLGLLGGFVVGAGANILKNSGKLQAQLFGTEEEEFKNGKLPPSISKFIKKRLPDVAKAGGLGAILGTLGIAPGGIYGGLILGAGIELVSTTDTFKNLMLGKEDINGERHGGILGALKTQVVDPLANFVKEGIKNIGGYIKKNFLEPVGKIFDPLKDWVKGKLTKTLDNITSKAKEKVKKTFDEAFGGALKRIAGVVGGAGKAALKGAGAIASAPFKLIGKAGEGLAKHNIKAGYSTKSAADRYAALGLKSPTGLYNRWAAGEALDAEGNKIQVTDEDRLMAANYLSGPDSFKRNRSVKRQKLADTITASLKGGASSNPALSKEIKKLFNTKDVIDNDNYDAIIDRINNLSDDQMGSKEREAIIKKIQGDRDSIKKDRDNEINFVEKKQAWLESAGLSGLTKRQLKKTRIQALVDAQGITNKSFMKSQEDIANARQFDINTASEKRLLEEQEKTNPIDKQRNSLLGNIVNLVSTIANKVSGKDVASDINEESKRNANRPVDSTISDKVNNLINPGSESSDKEGDRKTVSDSDGKPVDWIFKNGEWQIDNNDSENKANMEADEQDRTIRNKFFNMFVGGGLLDSMKNLFNPADGDDKTPTLFDKIKELFSGENSIFTKIFGALGGAGGIGSVLASALPVVLGGLGLGKVLGWIADKESGREYDPNMNSSTNSDDVKANEANEGFLTKAKRGFDTIQNKIMGRKTTTYDEDAYQSDYITDNLDKRMLLNVAMSGNTKLASTGAKVISKTVGKIPLVGKALAAPMKGATKAAGLMSKIGNFASKGIKTISSSSVGAKAAQVAQKAGVGLKNLGGKLLSTKAGTAVTTAGKNALTAVQSAVQRVAGSKAGTAVTDVVTKISDKVKPLFEKLLSKLGVNNADDAVEQISRGCAEGLEEAAGGSKLASLLGKVGLVIYIANIALAFEDGLENAKCKSILGIIDTPSWTQRLLAATMNGLNAAIPGIGGIIPTKVIFNIIYKLLTALGVDFGTLAEQRAAAEATVDQYNEANGTTYNVEEYIHNVLGEYTTQEKVGKAVSKAAKSVWGGIKGIFSKKDKSTTSVTSTTGTGSGIQTTVAGFTGSGSHAIQKGNFRRFGHSTIDENGCGPAAASSILGYYGKNVNVNDAASYAENGGYVAGNSGVGTRASYFGDIFGRNGIKTSYTSNRSEIGNAIASGNPTVLLGQDSTNRSKGRSPFGPNPHYVVARGTDSRGNIIVDDSELGRTAVYNKNILNKTKLGVVTGGDSGISGLLSSFISGTLSAASEKLGDTAAGKILGFISGSISGSESSSEDTGTTYNDDGGSVIYGANTPFPILTSKPKASDPNIKLYNNSNNGGLSKCVNGSPRDAVCNVLHNCVGWACARFNHIYNLMTGHTGIMFPNFCCNAENFIEVAKAYGLSVGQTPQVGAIMVWQKGATLKNADGAGHVAIVERVDSDTKVYTSESGYKNSKVMWNADINKGDGNWRPSWMGKNYTFRGFIYNPGVTAYLDKKSFSDAKTTMNEKRLNMTARGSGITAMTGVTKYDYSFGDSDFMKSVGAGSGNFRKYTGSSSGIKVDSRPTASRSQSMPKIDLSGRGSGTTSRSNRYHRYTGGAAAVVTPDKVSSDKTNDAIMLYLKQIASNTGYNTAIPSIISILQDTAKVLGQVVASSAGSRTDSPEYQDAANNMNNEINLMMAKLNTIAQTL